MDVTVLVQNGQLDLEVDGATHHLVAGDMAHVSAHVAHEFVPLTDVDESYVAKAPDPQCTLGAVSIGRSMEDAGLLTNFGDRNELGRQFARRYGFTPSEYRKVWQRSTPCPPGRQSPVS